MTGIPGHLTMVVAVLHERLRNYRPGDPPMDVGPVSLLVTNPETDLADQHTRDLIEWIARKGRPCRVYVQIDSGKVSADLRDRNASLFDCLHGNGSGDLP